MGVLMRGESEMVDVARKNGSMRTMGCRTIVGQDVLGMLVDSHLLSIKKGLLIFSDFFIFSFSHIFHKKTSLVYEQLKS